MIIAVTAQGNDLQGEVDPRFGRAKHFLLVDSETMRFEVVENEQNLSLPQGAGIQAAQVVTDHRAEVVLTGNCGPKAFKTLDIAGVKVVIGSKTVPIGSYTRDTLAKLPVAEEKAILANVRSEEPDVKGIVGKLTQGAADAGFVYVTDVNATNGALKAIDLPAAVEPEVTYAAGVVKGAKQPEAGKRFVDGLLHGACADALRKAGFGPAP